LLLDLARQEVRLELDVPERDRYGRLLAYSDVWDQIVNAELGPSWPCSGNDYPTKR